MTAGSVWRKARYCGSVALVYSATLLVAAVLFDPGLVHRQPPAFIPLAAADSLPANLSSQTPIIISGDPVRISLPRLGIDLKVQPGYYDSADNSWTLSDTMAQFAGVTAPANNYSGQTFIYGHRLQNIFGGLWRTKPGDEARIYTSNGHVFAYKFVSSQLVPPTDTSILAYHGPPILTVQTCGGSWDSQRQMFVFKFSKVIK